MLTGLVAAGTGLAVGELVAGFSSELRSPVAKVGDRVIDWVPKWMKNFAIRNFGTSDKTVLIWTIIAVIAIAAAVVGIVTVRGRRGVGIGFAVVFGLFGAWAGGFGRNTTLRRGLPALIAALVAGAVLMAGYAMAHPTAGCSGASVSQPHRRRAAGCAPRPAPLPCGNRAAGRCRSRDRRRSAEICRAGSTVRSNGPAFDCRSRKIRLPAPPADPATLPGNEGLSPLIVPIGDFYRIDTALYFPNISLSSWTLKIGGMVDRELTFTYDDLLRRDLIERDITMSCVSNPVGGDLVGNARWVGCRLDDLLDEAGIRQAAPTRSWASPTTGSTPGSRSTRSTAAMR